MFSLTLTDLVFVFLCDKPLEDEPDNSDLVARIASTWLGIGPEETDASLSVPASLGILLVSLSTLVVARKCNPPIGYDACTNSS